jgi:hypothetical protein
VLRNRIFGLIGAVAVLLGARVFAGLDSSYLLPLDDPAIQYAKLPVSDPVTQLQQRLDRGEVKLAYDPTFGYLPAVLKSLQAPVSSQVLVFSRTSFQASRIYPRSPRALYFNDRVAVGWVRTGEVLEIAAVDPRQGPIFFTMDQNRSRSPGFVRRDDCLQCHVFHGLGVPGFVVRSVHTDSSGVPLTAVGGFLTDHRSPLKDRWGGWYVTGTHGSQTHMGNTNPNRPDLSGDNVTDLSRLMDTGAYLSPHSDIVALMVLEHQARMQNLITRVNYETRLALESQAGMNVLNRSMNLPIEELSESNQRRIYNPAEELLGYMLFTDEARLGAPVRGTSGFAAEFSKQGPRDRRGRSLRDLDMTRRMFRYTCSYLIYSEAFDKLPDVVRERIYRRLWEVLSGQDRSAAFASISSADRQAILEILLDTKPGLPAYWRTKS